MIKAIARNGHDQSLHIGRLPRGSWCDHNFPDTQAPPTAPHLSTVYAVAVADQIVRCRLEGEGLTKLLTNPRSGRSLTTVEMNRASTFVHHNEETIQDPECGSRDGKEVAGSKTTNVVAKEVPPALRRWLPFPRQVLGN